MHAVRVTRGDLTIVDVDVPQPGADEALVKMSAAGVCHTDLHIRNGDWASGAAETMPLGHEGIGIVEALGPGAERFVSIGDRVILGLGGKGGFWCGSCEYCLSGFPRHCAQSQGVLGVFAEHFAAYAPALVVLPDSVSDEEASLACGGLTAYGAIKRLPERGIRPGRWVAVIGAAGGLGHYAVQMLTHFGYRVVGIDVGEERLAFARELGAEIAVGPDEAAEVITAEIGGVDASLVFAAKVSAFHLGFQILRKRGLLVGVGLPPDRDGDIHFSPMDLFFKDASIEFSAIGTVQDMREVVALAEAGHIRSHVSRTGALSELDQIFDELHAGSYVGRAVITDLSS